MSKEIAEVKTSHVGRAPGVIKGILSSVQQIGDIQRVIGEPVKQGERTVIPIVDICMFFGTGFGDGDKTGLTKSKSKSGSGGGVAGRIKSVPVGALEISSQGTRFIPVFRPGKSLLLLALGFMLGGWVARSKHLKMQKEQKKKRHQELQSEFRIEDQND